MRNIFKDLININKYKKKYNTLETKYLALNEKHIKVLEDSLKYKVFYDVYKDKVNEMKKEISSYKDKIIKLGGDFKDVKNRSKRKK